MKTVAIITEYNPFHNGHKYQIDTVRRMFDEDIAIIAIMSGNFTQRGEIAVADKLIRASAAVECGVDLVLELPFPYSMSSAEFFAKSGVHIANSLGVVDYLAFGSECGDIDKITAVAKNMQSDAFTSTLSERTADAKYAKCGYAGLCESVYGELFKTDDLCGFFTPNNILALEYVKALLASDSKIVPITVKRCGAGYNDSKISDTDLQSATAIRALMHAENAEAFDFVPPAAREIYKKATDDGMMPTDASRLDAAVISKLRLSSRDVADIHDAAGGLYNRLCELSTEATSISSLTSLTETRRYTTARIRRAIWNSFFGVTSSDVRSMPAYTQLLATDERGRSVLKRIKKMASFPVITKPADYKTYSDDVIRQRELSDRADSIFALTHKRAISGAFSLKFTPYVRK